MYFDGEIDFDFSWKHIYNYDSNKQLIDVKEYFLIDEKFIFEDYPRKVIEYKTEYY